MELAFSVDLEPNKDGSIDGIRDAMRWFDEVIPRGTVYTTSQIATELPEVVESLSEDHEIGVHVHPQEFGHEADDLAALSRDRQRELISQTRKTVAGAAGVAPETLTAFRAGRHKASQTTLDILTDIGFKIDASINVRYRNYMPDTMTVRTEPFIYNGDLVELPTTYAQPSKPSRVWARTFPNGNITATAHTLRTDRRGCSGLRALQWLFKKNDNVVSMYMHPYDAIDYHSDLENNGQEFRDRIKLLFDWSDHRFVVATDILTKLTKR
ncbi:hypothetical protein [Natronosalvus rutilus]|uniref:Polysaccharide deacetylase n=1 Tax=Natronosalvus rutilus TaxID=2953753 RepID=A0A9E7SW02_9EURY|nr:hypothetical protein [Natronosalvus rutilus]UTF54985.1 hypothetical protein NGM29_06960 [Natronosalvus rutilus]